MTIREIAKLANVSPSTVSIVLNNKEGVSDKTRKRILDLLNEYGYIPNRKKSVNKSSGNIRFLKYSNTGLLADKNDGFISEIIDAIEIESRKLGYNLILTTVNDQNLYEALTLVKSDQNMGMIFLGTELFDNTSYFLNNISIPFVIIDNYMPSYNINCVVMNNHEIVKQAIKYLFDLGHHNIGYVRSCVTINNFVERNRGFKDAMECMGLNINPKHEFIVMPSVEGAYGTMLDFLTSAKKMPTAFFCDNDTIAIGVMRALKESGYAIPDDVSVMGFDDIASAALIDTPLTTMRVSRISIGKWAVKLLMDAIDNPNSHSVKIQTSAKLKIRESTSPVK